MTYALFMEGTGQGVHERSNVSVLADACVQDGAQRVSLEVGPGARFGTIVTGTLFGFGALNILERQYEWLAQRYRQEDGAKIFLFGFSRGGHVDYLGAWDTVDSAVGIDGARFRKLPDGVSRARHAVARDERRSFFAYEPMEGKQAEEMVFPGCHSDVGGRYPDNHAVADVALAWVAAPAVEMGLRLKPGVSFSEELSPEAILHDSLHDATNVWGCLPSPPRTLADMPCHPSCGRFA